MIHAGHEIDHLMIRRIEALFEVKLRCIMGTIHIKEGDKK